MKFQLLITVFVIENMIINVKVLSISTRFVNFVKG